MKSLCEATLKQNSHPDFSGDFLKNVMLVSKGRMACLYLILAFQYL